MRTAYFKIILIILPFISFILISILVYVKPVNAAASCNVSVSPDSLSLSANSTLSFSISNTGSSSILWINIISPSDQFEISSVESPGNWAVQESDTTHASFYTEEILPGGSENFNISVVSGVNNVSQNWTIEASEEFNGGSSFSCGNPTVTIGTAVATSTPTTVTITNTVTNTVTNTTTNVVTKTVEIKDTIPPLVKYKTEFKKIYEEAPFVEIVSTDGTGIARVEYSIDGGENYLPIGMETIGSKSVSSEFTPDVTEDGDYSLQVRATDTTGNKQISKEVKFTIDRLPPRVGPLTVMAGPLIINSDSSGKMELLIGVEYKFILTSAGGPNSISLRCSEENYEFFKNNDIGVWTTKVKFSESGSCIPEITAVDGAGNKQQINSEKLIINNLGQAKNSTITVYWYDDYEKKFVKWDAEPYGQINPIMTNETGGYSFLLPAGKYYLESRAVGKRTSVSNIIVTNQTSYINDDWELSPAWKFWQISKAWPMITLVKEVKQINPKVLGSNMFKEVNFALPKVNINSLSTLDIRGKSAVVSLLSSWHPATNNYLKVMDELTKNKYSVYPILVQEKESSATALKRRGGYGLNIYADPDGEILNDIKIEGLPTTWIVNRFGQIIKEKTGDISYEEVIEVLNSI